MAYTTYGDPDGTPVLLLHGTPGSRLLGEVFAEHAGAHGVRLLAVDRPGYGQSSPRSNRSPSTVANDIDVVLADAGVDRLGVAAFSGGSPYAYALASESDASVTSIDVVAGTVPPSLPGDPPRVLRAIEALAERTPRTLGGLLRVQTTILRYAPSSAVTGQYVSSDADTQVPEEIAAVLKRDFLEAFAGTTQGFVAESRGREADWRGLIKDVGAPVRHWHGTRDTNVPIEGPRTLVERFSTGELIEFDRADHLGTLLEARRPILERHGDGA